MTEPNEPGILSEPRDNRGAAAPAEGRLSAFLFAPVDAASLGAFRILFGALMLWEVSDAWRSGHIAELTHAAVLFPFELVSFVAPWPAPWMYVHYALMGLGALGILLGFHYRLAAALFLVTYGYAFLLDKASYNNHYYLIVLLAFLLLLADADRWASLDQKRRPRPAVVPFWNLFLLRAQVFIVFLYAGIAKLNADWLAGEPMRTWLADERRTPIIGPLLGSEAAVWFFTYGGLAFDLSVGFLLLSPRTLPFALAGMLAFNLMNHWLFSIGVFPFLMLATALLFESPAFPRRIFGGSPPRLETAPPPARARALITAFVASYLAVQLLLPLRHWLYPGEVNWTEEGHRFAWHMKLRSKHGWVRYQVTDPRTGEVVDVDPRAELTLRQRRKLPSCPDMILQYAHHLAARQRSQGVENPVVRADTWVSLNRRPPQHLVDPEENLAEADASVFAASPWIVPLDESGRPGSISLGEFGELGLRRRRD